MDDSLENRELRCYGSLRFALPYSPYVYAKLSPAPGISSIFTRIAVAMMSSLLLFSIPVFAKAAEIHFDPQDSSIGTEGEFLVGVNLTSEERVNAISLVLPIPTGLRLMGVSDGNSIVTLFVEQPSFDDDERSLSFSGVIPNGFSGEEGRLVTLTFAPEKRVGSATFVLDPGSEAYAKEGEPVALYGRALTLPFAAGKRNLQDFPPDRDPPEEFDPVLIPDPSPQGSGLLIAFSTVDKASGIERYEVKESVWGNWFPSYGWQETTSPHRLTDATRTSWVYVRATDEAGNSYVAMIPPERSPFVVYIPILLGIIVLLFIVYARYARRSR